MSRSFNNTPERFSGISRISAEGSQRWFTGAGSLPKTLVHTTQPNEEHFTIVHARHADPNRPATVIELQLLALGRLHGSTTLTVILPQKMLFESETRLVTGLHRGAVDEQQKTSDSKKGLLTLFRVQMRGVAGPQTLPRRQGIHVFRILPGSAACLSSLHDGVSSERGPIWTNSPP